MEELDLLNLMFIFLNKYSGKNVVKDFYSSFKNNKLNYFNTDESLENELEILSNIERDELINVINRLNLCGIYVMEGNK